MSGIQPAEDLGGIQTGALGQGFGDNLKGLAKLLDRVLCQTLRLLTDSLYPLDEFDLSGASSGHESGVLGNGLDHVYTIVNSPLHIIQVVLGGAAEDERGCPCRLVLLSKNGHTVAADLLGLDNVDTAHLVGHRSTEPCQRGGADDPAYAAE